MVLVVGSGSNSSCGETGGAVWGGGVGSSVGVVVMAWAGE